LVKSLREEMRKLEKGKKKEKRTYEAPKLSFTPLKPEERLLQCDKVDPGICDIINS
jgi:hypothetical protein